MSFDTVITNATLPDGRTGIGIAVKDGKIASSMVSDDDLGLLQQLGATIQLP